RRRAEAGYDASSGRARSGGRIRPAVPGWAAPGLAAAERRWILRREPSGERLLLSDHRDPRSAPGGRDAGPGARRREGFDGRRRRRERAIERRAVCPLLALSARRLA